jgi:hypothetical protein
MTYPSSIIIREHCHLRKNILLLFRFLFKQEKKDLINLSDFSEILRLTEGAN